MPFSQYREGGIFFREKVEGAIHKMSAFVSLGDDGGSDDENEGGGNGPKRGRKGFENVQDYLIPVIQLMRNGKSHKEVFRTVAEKLKVNYNTVSAQCTRGLEISTQEFIEHVRSGQIIQIMKNKYPDKRELIDRELSDLYI